MEMRVPFHGIGSKGVYCHHPVWYTLFKSDNFPEKSQQAPVCALTQAAQQGTVVLEIDSQHDGNGKNILPVGNRKVVIVTIEYLPQG